MTWQPDPLLVEVFESVQLELARALEALERHRASDIHMPAAAVAEAAKKIGNLTNALAALEGALDIAQSRLVH